jgi:hypothetical protein
MLAVILVIVVGTIHHIGSQANNVFSRKRYRFVEPPRLDEIAPPEPLLIDAPPVSG